MNVVFHREVMGDRGLFFTAANGDLCEILRRVDAEPEAVADLRAVAKSRSDSLYRWDAVTAAYAELFKRVVESKRGKRPLVEAMAGRLYRPEEFFGDARR
jgi:hypothetical protein